MSSNLPHNVVTGVVNEGNGPVIPENFLYYLQNLDAADTEISLLDWMKIDSSSVPG
jgi:hypothetical protein